MVMLVASLAGMQEARSRLATSRSGLTVKSQDASAPMRGASPRPASVVPQRAAAARSHRPWLWLAAGRAGHAGAAPSRGPRRSWAEAALSPPVRPPPWRASCSPAHPALAHKPYSFNLSFCFINHNSTRCFSLLLGSAHQLFFWLNPRPWRLPCRWQQAVRPLPSRPEAGR